MAAQLSGRSSVSIDELIEQAYRQIYFHAFKVDRDSSLESQLRSGQINVRDFARSLLLSSKFRDDFYRCNSNYRMVEQIVGRVLGRAIHGEMVPFQRGLVLAGQAKETQPFNLQAPPATRVTGAMPHPGVPQPVEARLGAPPAA